MLFYQTFIFIFISLFLSCNALLCTKNCTFTYNLTTSFKIPDQCNQTELAGKCYIRLVFYYNLGEYFFSFSASPLSTIFRSDNKRHAKLYLSSLDSVFLSYYIDRACKNKDDCARDLAINEANEMLQRQINFPNMIDELKPLMIGPPLTTANSNLNCYDEKENVRQCATSMTPGACVLSNEIAKDKINRSCKQNPAREIFVSMYQTDNDNTFDFQCDRSLCNDQSTLRDVKQIMFKYNVTATLDGRLDGSRLIRSISLMLMMVFTLLFNQF